MCDVQINIDARHGSRAPTRLCIMVMEVETHSVPPLLRAVTGVDRLIASLKGHSRFPLVTRRTADPFSSSKLPNLNGQRQFESGRKAMHGARADDARGR